MKIKREGLANCEGFTALKWVVFDFNAIIFSCYKFI